MDFLTELIIRDLYKVTKEVLLSMKNETSNLVSLWKQGWFSWVFIFNLPVYSGWLVVFLWTGVPWYAWVGTP